MTFSEFIYVQLFPYAQRHNCFPQSCWKFQQNDDMLRWWWSGSSERDWWKNCILLSKFFSPSLDFLSFIHIYFLFHHFSDFFIFTFEKRENFFHPLSSHGDIKATWTSDEWNLKSWERQEPNRTDAVMSPKEKKIENLWMI